MKRSLILVFLLTLGVSYQIGCKGPAPAPTSNNASPPAGTPTPEVGNDFGRDARAFLSRRGINEGDMDVIPFEQRILAINALAAKTERETVIVLCVKHERIKCDQLTFTQRDCFAL